MSFFVKISVSLGLAASVLALPTYSVAQETPKSELPTTSDVENLNSDDGFAKSNDQLDKLFDQLRKQTKPSRAQATANKIWREWYSSGSANIDLLMSYVARAVDKKNYPAAIDLLNQITTLAPEYAEGWNRRATVYFYMGDFSRSLADVETTLQLEPRHFGSISGLAAILQKLNREEEALNAWYKVLEIYPANAPAQKAVIDLEEELAGKRT